MMTGATMRPGQDRRRYLAEIESEDGRLLRRVRARTAAAALEWALYQIPRIPLTRALAAAVKVYATADEPSAPPVLTVKI